MFGNQYINEGRKSPLTVLCKQRKRRQTSIGLPRVWMGRRTCGSGSPIASVLTVLSIQLPERWLQAFTTCGEGILGGLWPLLAQAPTDLTLLTCNSRSALPSWPSPLSVRASPRRPERRLFRPARRARASSTASQRVELTCLTFILLSAAPNRAAWSKLRELPSKGRHRVTPSFL